MNISIHTNDNKIQIQMCGVFTLAQTNTINIRAMWAASKYQTYALAGLCQPGKST